MKDRGDILTIETKGKSSENINRDVKQTDLKNKGGGGARGSPDKVDIVAVDTQGGSS